MGGARTGRGAAPPVALAGCNLRELAGAIGGQRGTAREMQPVGAIGGQ